MLWRRSPPVETKPEPSPVKSDLEVRLERLERSVRDLRLDWDATYEKFAKLYARLVKRAKAEEESAAAQDAPGSTIVAPNGESHQPDRWMALKAAQAKRGGAK